MVYDMGWHLTQVSVLHVAQAGPQAADCSGHWLYGELEVPLSRTRVQLLRNASSIASGAIQGRSFGI